MITKELSEAAVEVNVILENCSHEVLKKVPYKFREFMKKIESKTYKFNYDSSKSLNEQKLKPKTRRLVSLIYSDYLCEKDEKQEYLRQLNEFFEKEKCAQYYANDIFEQKKPKKEKGKSISLIKVKKENFFKKLIMNIKRILHIS